MVVTSVDSRETHWLVDTGATISVVRPNSTDKAVVDSAILTKGVTGHDMNTVGSQELVLEFEIGLELSDSFKVCHLEMGAGETEQNLFTQSHQKHRLVGFGDTILKFLFGTMN
jgi:hypothetical protein